MLLLFVLMFALIGLSVWAGSRVKRTFAEHNKVPLRSGMSGAEVAQVILRAGGIRDVQIASVPGLLSDHYDPRRRIVALSPEVLNGRTAAAAAVAAHEVGHALQHAKGYGPMQVRDKMVPAVNFASQLSLPMILVGAFTGMMGWMWVGVIAFGVAVLFHVVTLPVEFDASNRAIRILEQSGIVAADEMPGVRKTLYAAGFTYLAAALIAVVQLLYFLLPLLGGSDE